METKQELSQKEDKKADERIIRILSRDIEGSKMLYHGLTKIKGISWGLANAVCRLLKFEKTRKVGSLTAAEIKKIEEFMKNPTLPKHLVNRQTDFAEGEGKHLVGSDLELKTEFDVKRLKKIKSYRGFRHMSGLPLRGQRTRSNFRRNRKKGAGIKKKK